MKHVNRTKGWVRAIILLCLFTFSPFIAAAQQIIVTVDSVGKLGEQLPDSIRYTIEDLKICGPLNGTDIKVIQQMTSRMRPKKAGEAVLKSIDLSEASIPEGKGSFRTKADVLPAAMFLNCKVLERIVLPNTTQEVGRSCFSGCTNLKEVVFPDTTRIIGDYAFNNCSSMDSIKLPAQLTTIDNHAFDGCQALKSISIPKNVTLIDVYAFNNCKMLEKVEIVT